MASYSKSKKHMKSTVTKRLGLVARLKTRASDLRAGRRRVPKLSALPGYTKFTRQVFRALMTYRNHFFILLTLYVVLATLFVGLIQQDQYQYLNDVVTQFGPELFGGQIDVITKSIGLFGVTASGGLNAALSETQQVLLGLLYLVTWLVSIWMLRQLFAKNIVRVRDALYNACAPFISTLLVILLMAAQSIPAAVGILLFSIATQGSGVDSVVALLFGVGALLLILLSLYWLTSSVFALLIVTLPGTYPMAAIRAAGGVAIGRRLPLMIRLLWLGLVTLLIWAIVLIPVLLLDSWLNTTWIPFVPITIQILSGFSILFATTYIYMLYRGMIDEPVS